MNIEIKGKDVELKFGMKFIRELDEKFKHKLGDSVVDQFGLSVSIGVPMIMAGDPTVLADFLYYGTNYMKSGRPTPTDIDDYIDGVEDIDAVYDEVIEELKKSNACGKQAIAAEEAMKEEQAKAQLNSTTK
ncbi:MAG: tail assembly chaperone [Bacteroidales bacterium]|nr:tail assembly chaperone [Bacteroidales bacterium]MCC8177357.1 tail assembly chaperone [Bacteroidales bacterium]